MICFVESFGFEWFTNKSPDDTHADDLLAQNLADVVDAFLHGTELWDDANNDGADREQQDRN